jgi:hypothetical protein
MLAAPPCHDSARDKSKWDESCCRDSETHRISWLNSDEQSVHQLRRGGGADEVGEKADNIRLDVLRTIIVTIARRWCPAAF